MADKSTCTPSNSLDVSLTLVHGKDTKGVQHILHGQMFQSGSLILNWSQINARKGMSRNRDFLSFLAKDQWHVNMLTGRCRGI